MIEECLIALPQTLHFRGTEHTVPRSVAAAVPVVIFVQVTSFAEPHGREGQPVVAVQALDDAAKDLRERPRPLWEAPQVLVVVLAGGIFGEERSLRRACPRVPDLPQDWIRSHQQGELRQVLAVFELSRSRVDLPPTFHRRRRSILGIGDRTGGRLGHGGCRRRCGGQGSHSHDDDDDDDDDGDE